MGRESQAKRMSTTRHLQVDVCASSSSPSPPLLLDTGSPERLHQSSTCHGADRQISKNTEVSPLVSVLSPIQQQKLEMKLDLSEQKLG